MKKAIPILILLILFLSIPFITSFIMGQADKDNYVFINDGGKTIKMDRNEFLVSAVISVSDESFSDETLKALATVFSTLLEYEEIKADSQRGILLVDADSVEKDFKSRVEAAVQLCGKNVLLYQGKPIYSVYHKSSSGRTLNAENVFGQKFDYLVSVESDETVGEQVFSQSELKEKIGITSDFSVTLFNDDNSVCEVSAGEMTFSGAEFRVKLGIVSPVFSLREENGNLYVSYKGEGHGVGLSLMGAQALAEKGMTAEEILSHYYFGVEIAKIVQ